MAQTREKRTLSPCSGSDEEIPTTPKRMKILQPSCLSPVQKLSPTDSVTSPSSCEKRADESSESPQSPKFRGRRRNLRDFSKGKTMCLQANFKMLKERMESTELSEKLYAKGFLDEEDFENILKGKSREKRNEILLKALSKPRYRENISSFLSALVDSGQSQLLKEHLSRPNFDALPEISNDEMGDLLTFASQMKEKLLEEVEPRRFIDDIVSAGGISIEDHESISTMLERRKRVQFLLDKVGSVAPTIAVRILKSMADMYSDLYQAFKDSNSGNSTKAEETKRQEGNAAAALGAQLTLKYNIIPTTTCVQDKNEHDAPATKMKRVKEEAEEIEKAIVASLNENQTTQLDQMFENCITELRQIKFSSIKIYMKVLSKGSHEKLATYSRSGAAKRLFLSLLDEETKGKLLAMNAKVKIEIYKGCECSIGAVPCATECLCTLDKEKITRNFTSLMKDMRCSRGVMDRIMKMKFINNKAKKSMEEIKGIRQIEVRNEHLLNFLLQTDLPKVCFCVLEEEVINHGGDKLLRHILKDENSTFDSKSLVVLNKTDIRDNKDLLRKEVEARWFINRLENKKNHLTEALIGNILAKPSREERVDALLEYLVKEKDISWFVEELKAKNEHLLNTLLKNKMPGKDSVDVSADISRCKNATRYFIDDIIEEIDPLIISKWISVKAKEELHFSELERLRERKKRATKFSLQLLRTSQSIFYEALHAMTACGYENLVENITTLAKEGPLNTRYKCAKIQHIESCERFGIMTDEFTIEGYNLHDQAMPAQKNMDADHDPVKSVDSNSENDCLVLNAEVCNPAMGKDNPRFTEIFDTSPMRLKLSRRSRVQSIKGGSESGIFSGSGVNTEDINTDEDSDYEDRSSEVDKRSMTKEWIESLSKSSLSDILAPISPTLFMLPGRMGIQLYPIFRKGEMISRKLFYETEENSRLYSPAGK